MGAFEVCRVQVSRCCFKKCWGAWWFHQKATSTQHPSKLLKLSAPLLLMTATDCTDSAASSSASASTTLGAPAAVQGGTQAAPAAQQGAVQAAVEGDEQPTTDMRTNARRARFRMAHADRGGQTSEGKGKPVPRDTEEGTSKKRKRYEDSSTENSYS